MSYAFATKTRVRVGDVAQQLDVAPGDVIIAAIEIGCVDWSHDSIEFDMDTIRELPEPWADIEFELDDRQLDRFVANSGYEVTQ